MKNYDHCVKCGTKKTNGTECPHCGVIYEKAEKNYKEPPPSLIPCIVCGKMISVNAQSCPHCGEPKNQPAEQNKTSSNENHSKDTGPKKITINPRIAVPVVLIIVFLASLEAMWSDEDKAAFLRKNLSNLESYAYLQCQDFVKQRLKAPSTAKFPLDMRFKDLGGNTYVIKSYVDAQNSFGARIRTEWACQTRYIGGDTVSPNSWEFINLEML